MMTATLRPESEAEVGDMVRSALAAKSPLEIRGGGSRSALGRPVEVERILHSGGLSGIGLYEPGALCLVVRAGTPLAMVEDALAAENQRLPFEPMDHRTLLGTQAAVPTIGGIVACGASGPRRIQAGACRDSLIGVRFVNGKGEIVKNGGRVMKNVTGYDLVKLMCGSYGTLGVLTEVSFKLLPRPEAEATVIVEGLDDVRAVEALCDALGSPFDVSGAAHLTEAVDGVARTLVRVEGFETSVAYRARRLADVLGAAGPVCTMSGDDSAGLWRKVRDCAFFAGTGEAVWRVSAKPTDGPRLVGALDPEAGFRAWYDWGGGLVWLAVADEGDAGASVLRAVTGRSGGHATLVRANERTRSEVAVFEPEPAPVAVLSAGLKQAFDPLGILNPGRMRP